MCMCVLCWRHKDNCSLNTIFMTYVPSMTEITDEAKTNSYVRPYHQNRKFGFFSGLRHPSNTALQILSRRTIVRIFLSFASLLLFSKRISSLDITFPFVSASIFLDVCGQFVSHRNSIAMEQSLFSIQIKCCNLWLPLKMLLCSFD